MAGPNILDVQSAAGNGVNLALPAFAVDAVAGGVIVVGYSLFNFGVGTTLVPTDSKGNTYVQIGTTKVQSSAGLAMFYAKNIAAGPTTVTCHPNGTFAAAVAWLLKDTDTVAPYNGDWIGDKNTTVSAAAGPTTPAPLANSIFIALATVANANNLGEQVGWGTEGANGFTAAMHGRAKKLDWAANDDIQSTYKISSSVETSTWPSTTGGIAWAAMVASFAPVQLPVPTGVLPAVVATIGGDTLTISGSGFTLTTGVTVGGVAATNVQVVNDGSITCTAPAHAAGGAIVTVTSTTGSGSLLASQLTYAVKPVPTGVNPVYALRPAGGTVTITGSGFLAGATVDFGGTPATNVVVVDANTITCTVPDHAAGQTVVTVTNP
jgi:hypothetical protein